MKEDFYASDVILSREAGSDQKINKKHEEGCLTENPEGLDESVFFRPFFFQWLISPDRALQIPSAVQFGDREDLRVSYRKSWQ